MGLFLGVSEVEGLEIDGGMAYLGTGGSGEGLRDFVCVGEREAECACYTRCWR